MIKRINDKWFKHKDELLEVIKHDENITECDYTYLVKLIVKHIINSGDTGLLYSEDITAFGADDYQGRVVFILNPEENDEGSYVIATYEDYGSCSVCDTLLGIQYDLYYDEEPADKNQAYEDLMTLCLHLVQNMRYIAPYNWGKDGEYGG